MFTHCWIQFSRSLRHRRRVKFHHLSFTCRRDGVTSSPDLGDPSRTPRASSSTRDRLFISPWLYYHCHTSLARKMREGRREGSETSAAGQAGRTLRLAVVARPGLTSPCASSRARAPLSTSKLSGSTRTPRATRSSSTCRSRRRNDLRFMAARGTLLLPTLFRSFELGRSPSTASSFPTSRLPLPSPDALAIPPPSPLPFSLCVRVCPPESAGFSSFLGCVRRTPFTRVTRRARNRG